MLPLYDMMMQAQNGEAMKTMARQFGLDEDQVTRAMEALMPAFSAGLKRNATDPASMMEFWQSLAETNYTQYFENMSKAFSPQGVEQGNQILGYLFGSKDLSRAVAQQAAQVTGIAQEIYKRMLPVVASTMMGGLFKQATGGFGSQSSGSSGNIFADMMAQMMEQAQKAGASAFDNPYAKMMEQMFGKGAEKPAPMNPMTDNPFAKMFEGMMAAAAKQSGKEPEPSANPYDKLFGNMFEAGREIQKDYQKNMDAIFDSYLSGMKDQKK